MALLGGGDVLLRMIWWRGGSVVFEEMREVYVLTVVRDRFACRLKKFEVVDSKVNSITNTVCDRDID